MVEGFKGGVGGGLGPGGALGGQGKGLAPAAPASAPGGIARLGTPRAANLPAAQESAVPVPVAANMPARVSQVSQVSPDAAPRPQGVETGGLVRELASAPPVDSARVAELRAWIAADLYRPDPERIASAMIASELLPNDRI